MDQKGIMAAGTGGQAGADGGAKPTNPGLALLATLGPSRILALGGVALLLLGFFAFVISRAAAPSYSLLFSELELRDAQQLTQRLDSMGVRYRLSAGGDAIMVPSDEVLRLRMSLAQDGLPVGATVGYELFDRADPFTTSDFLGNVNLRRAVEGELARTIGTLRQVRAARVHIVEPKRSLFGREEVRPSASIVLSLRQRGSLDRRQVDGIRHLVAAAVPGLAADSVTIVDDAGDLLAEPDGGDGDQLAIDRTEEHRVAFENRVRGKIVQLLERSLGQGKVEAAVSADLDFDEVATTAELYDPDAQVVRSTQTAEEASDAKERQADQSVSVANNLPTERAQAETGPGSSERRNRTEETVNYEISRTVRNQTKRGSTVRKLSIAVQVDGTWTDRPDGGRDFQPRSAEELAQIKELVRSAAGVDEKRGDVVEVVSRPFLAAEVGAPDETSPSLLADLDYSRLLELGVLAALTLVVLLFGVRPFLNRLMPASTEAAGATPVAVAAESRPLLGQRSEGELLGQVPSSGADAALIEAQASSEGALLTLETKSAATNPLDDAIQAIDSRPEDAARVIRAWLQGGA